MVKRSKWEFISPEESSRLRARLKEKSLTQTEVAAQLGITQSHISNVLNAKCSISYSIKDKLYSLLELDIPPTFQELPHVPLTANTFEKADQLHLYSLFVDYVNILQAHYQKLPKEEKLKLLAGLEALVQDYKLDSSE